MIISTHFFVLIGAFLVLYISVASVTLLRRVPAGGSLYGGATWVRRECVPNIREKFGYMSPYISLFQCHMRPDYKGLVRRSPASSTLLDIPIQGLIDSDQDHDENHVCDVCDTSSIGVLDTLFFPLDGNLLARRV